MKIASMEVLAATVGWRQMYYLKVTTDTQLSGWAEFVESFGNPGLSAVITALKPNVVGRDALDVERISHDLNVRLRPARGGLNRQAVAAVENALLDIKGKAYGVPVADLMGGRVRDQVPVYWSHCGTYRTGHYVPHLNVTELHSYADATAFAKEVRSCGFRSLKTNILALEDPELAGREIRFARGLRTTGRGVDNRMIAEAEKTIAAMRAGAGDDADIFFDVNYCFDFDGYRRLEQVLRPFRPAWLELDSADAHGLAVLRRQSETPIGSGEGLYERVGYRPFFEAAAFDVAIIDVPWNGFLEASRIAAQAETYSTPVAPHNFYGHLSTAISAQFAAVVPNLHIMEIDIDGAPIRDAIATPPKIIDGELVLSDAPGWGVDINESLLRPVDPRRLDV